TRSQKYSTFPRRPPSRSLRGSRLRAGLRSARARNLRGLRARARSETTAVLPVALGVAQVVLVPLQGLVVLGRIGGGDLLAVEADAVLDLGALFALLLAPLVVAPFTLAPLVLALLLRAAPFAAAAVHVAFGVGQVVPVPLQGLVMLGGIDRGDLLPVETDP